VVKPPKGRMIAAATATIASTQARGANTQVVGLPVRRLSVRHKIDSTALSSPSPHKGSKAIMTPQPPFR